MMATGGPAIVIVGGGFAGAATAYHLVRRGFRRVVLLEREPVCGAHASGRNAGMVRQIVPEAAVAAMARTGAAFIRRPPDDWEGSSPFAGNGSILLATGDGWERLRDQGTEAARHGVPVSWETLDSLRASYPFFSYTAPGGGVRCATDGVADIAALLEGFLRGFRRDGGDVRTGAAVEGIEVRNGRVRAVASSVGRLDADVVVNAAGAWAGTIGRAAGAAALPLRPCRRHLFLAGPAAWVDPRWPFLWDVTHAFYARPESGGVLLSACDETDHPPTPAETDPAVRELLAGKLVRFAPALAGLPIRTMWAGLRTLTPDGRFAIGWDPAVEGFFWVAGLGGHGVTAAAAVGALAARLIDEGPPAESPAFSPRRFDAAASRRTPS
jgi:glycine/D-amino acid oxidase-like deaminating enzyme